MFRFYKIVIAIFFLSFSTVCTAQALKNIVKGVTRTPKVVVISPKPYIKVGQIGIVSQPPISVQPERHYIDRATTTSLLGPLLYIATDSSRYKSNIPKHRIDSIRRSRLGTNYHLLPMEKNRFPQPKTKKTLDNTTN